MITYTHMYSNKYYYTYMHIYIHKQYWWTGGSNSTQVMMALFLWGKSMWLYRGSQRRVWLVIWWQQLVVYTHVTCTQSYAIICNHHLHRMYHSFNIFALIFAHKLITLDNFWGTSGWGKKRAANSRSDAGMKSMPSLRFSMFHHHYPLYNPPFNSSL